MWVEKGTTIQTQAGMVLTHFHLWLVQVEDEDQTGYRLTYLHFTDKPVQWF